MHTECTVPEAFSVFFCFRVFIPAGPSARKSILHSPVLYTLISCQSLQSQFYEVKPASLHLTVALTGSTSFFPKPSPTRLLRPHCLVYFFLFGLIFSLPWRFLSLPMSEWWSGLLRTLSQSLCLAGLPTTLNLATYQNHPWRPQEHGLLSFYLPWTCSPFFLITITQFPLGDSLAVSPYGSNGVDPISGSRICELI